MADRLSPLDVSFLYLEGRTTPMHVGGLAVFEPPAGGFDYEQLIALIEQRISLVPRYRQRIVGVPGHLANPVWADDAEFDITYHVRRSALPRPGTDEQLLEFCARIQSRSLDRQRPLWEMYLIEGLAGGRVAIATKTHHAIVDGVSSVDIAQVILDVSPEPRAVPDVLWMPEPLPSPAQLLVSAAFELVRRPALLADTVRMGISDVRATAGRVTSMAGGVGAAIISAVRPPLTTPLNVTIGEQRRIAVARTSLDHYQQVHLEQDLPVNDVILATVAGALRGWLLSRGGAVASGSTIRVMAPVGLRAQDPAPAPAGLAAMFLDLPVGEPSPVLRLRQIGFATRADRESGRSVAADTVSALSGFAPPTLHAMSARLAGGLTRRLYDLLVTNVAGPQIPLYAAGARMLEMFPIVPLGRGQALAIGLTSYDGGVFYGLNADRDAMPDVEVLACLIEESLAELVAASAVSVRRPGTRRARAGARRGPRR